MRKTVILVILTLVALSGCKHKKSEAEKNAEAAQLQYEQTIIENAQARIIRANEDLTAVGMMPLDTALTFEMMRTLHGKDLEEFIDSIFETKQ